MSALVPIEHQPVNLLDLPERHDCPGCDNADEPCPEYGPKDPVYLQLRNEPQPVTTCLSPCAGGDALNPCGDFLVDVNLCSDPGFWTFTGDWDYGTCPSLENRPPYGSGTATLDVSVWQALTAGVYRFSFNLNTITTGGVQLSVGSLTSPTYTTVGTFDWVVYVDPANLNLPLILRALSGTDARVISLRIGRAGRYWEGLQTGAWTLDEGSCCWQHVPGTTTPLYFNYAFGFGTYKVSVTLSGVTDPQQYVDIFHGYTFLRRLYGNGPTVFYFTASGPDVLYFYPSAEWDGTLCLEELAESPRCHSFALVSGTQVLTQLGPVYYEGDYVTLGPFQLDELVDENGDPIPAACYQIAVWDCTEAGGSDLWEVIRNPDLQTSVDWTVDPLAGDYDWADDPDIPVPYFEHRFQTSNLFRGALLQAIDGRTNDDGCYVLTVRVESTRDFNGAPLPFLGSFEVNCGSFTSGTLTPTADTEYVFYLNPIGAGELSLDFVDTQLAISYVSLQPCAGSLPVSLATFVSSCVKLADAVECDSAYLEGSVPGTYQEPNLDPAVQDWRSPVAYGFQWNRYFHLAQRCPTYFLNPTSDGEDSRYPYRDGRNLRTAGAVESRWDLVLGRQGYVSHQALATLVKCQEVRIVRGVDAAAPGTKYLVTSEEYAPNWPKTARAHVADVQLEVVRLEKSRRYLRAIF